VTSDPAERREFEITDKTHEGAIVNGSRTIEAHSFENVEVKARTAKTAQTFQGIAARNKGWRGNYTV
jgi:hypothetical protein